MKFTLSWLREFLDFNEPLEKILDTLTFAGLEVEEVQDLGAKFAGFTVAEIKDFTKHPDADKLNVCTVETNQGTQQIVCGAPNVKANMKVILAPIGAVVPANGMKIKKVKIRGVESCGMMCSLSELGEGDNHEGIVEVDSKFAIGTKAAEVFGLDDTLIELAITPNRGDACSVYGIARELAANNIGKLKTIKPDNAEANFDSKTTITNQNDAIFKQFNLIEITGIKNTESPDWLKQRLKSVGITPKSAIIDITNYFCLAYGQPMHCYDKDKISGGFKLEALAGNEDFTALGGEEYKLEKGDIVIKDQDKIIALAGIIGAENSGSNIDTTSILLEAAQFDHISVTKTGRKHQIITDSRFRFEREIDSSNVVHLLELAASMIIDICGGTRSQLISTTANLKQPEAIKLAKTKITNYLGVEISEAEIDEILTRLNFLIIENNATSIITSPPPYRNDIALDIDVIEEIARIYGINKIPEKKFEHKIINKNLGVKPSFYDVRRKLAACGLNEVTNFPFTDHSDNNNFGDTQKAIVLLNPINATHNQLRISLIGSLLKNINHAQKHDLNMQSFFEFGNICVKSEDTISEEQRLGIVRVGPRTTKQVNNEASEFDIFDIKADLEEIFQTLGLPAEKITYSPTECEYLHPAKAFAITYAGKEIGFIGELHPILNKAYEVNGKVQIIELKIDEIRLGAKKAKKFKINDLQKLERDLAFVISDDIEAGALQSTIMKQAPELISNVLITDVFKGKNIETGFKSVAFNIKIQPVNDNLKSEEIDQLINKIIKQVETKFNCKLRS